MPVVFCQENVTIKKGSRLAGVGAGKVQEGGVGVPVAFEAGDKTFIELSVGNGEAADDEAAASKMKRGTFYTVVKDVSRTMTDSVKVTGFEVEIRDPSNGSGHGYNLKAMDKTFKFIVKDKAVTSWSSGNIAKNVASKEATVGLNAGVMWLWRYNLDPIHAKMTAKKPFLGASADLSLEKDKPLKLTKALAA